MPTSAREEPARANHNPFDDMPAWTGQASVRDGRPLHVLENAGHFMVAEPPEAYLEALRAPRQPLTKAPIRAACTTNRQERLMLHLISQEIKAIARRTLGELFPRGDVAALAEVVHPNFIDHDSPPGAPQGLDGMTWSIQPSRQGVGDAVQDLNAEDDPPAELIETGRLHAGNDVVGTSEVLSQLHTMRHQTGALHD